MGFAPTDATIKCAAACHHLTELCAWRHILACDAIRVNTCNDALNIESRLEGPPEDSDNLYYYGHLAKFRATDLITRMCELHQGEPGTATRSEQDLAAQIIINSRITRSKMQLFSLASVPFLLGVIVMFVSRIVAVVI